MFEPRDQSVAGKVLSRANAHNLGDFWIGIHDRYNEGTFVYESDNALLSSTNWGAGEPNDNTSGEDCVEVNRWNDWNWNDLPCSYQQRSTVCLREVGKGAAGKGTLIFCTFFDQKVYYNRIMTKKQKNSL